MSFRLLIDTCLPLEPVQVAVAAGYPESTCARDRGLLAKKDREPITSVVSGDFTLVTRNARDFRGAGATDPGGIHAARPVHAGVEVPYMPGKGAAWGARFSSGLRNIKW